MHLTARAYALLSITAALAIAGLWSPGTLFEAWRIAAATGVILVCLEYRSLQRHLPALRRSPERRVHLGQPFQLSVRVSNASSLPLTLRAIQDLPPGLEGARAALNYELAPGASAEAGVRVRPQRLGTFHFDIVYIRMLGCFGLVWWSRRVSLPGQSEVVPALLQSTERRVVTSAGGAGQLQRRGGGQEFQSLRDYVPGDPLRTIDWKATARRATPVVRVFGEERHLELLVVIDLSRRSALGAGALDRLGYRVNIAARLAEQAIANGDSVGILTFADRVLAAYPPATGMETLVQVRRILATCSSHSVEPALLPVALAARGLLRRRSLVAVFTELDIEARGGQWLGALRLLTAKHLPMLACMRDTALEALAERPPSDWRDAHDALAAQTMLETAQANVAHARRLGARVVSARPEELDRAIVGTYEELRRRRSV